MRYSSGHERRVRRIVIWNRSMSAHPVAWQGLTEERAVLSPVVKPPAASHQISRYRRVGSVFFLLRCGYLQSGGTRHSQPPRAGPEQSDTSPRAVARFPSRARSRVPSWRQTGVCVWELDRYDLQCGYGNPCLTATEQFEQRTVLTQL